MKGTFSLALFFRVRSFVCAPSFLPSPSLACHLHLESKASRFKEELAALSDCLSVDGDGFSFCSSFAPPPHLSSSSPSLELCSPSSPLSFHFPFLKATHHSTQHSHTEHIVLLLLLLLLILSLVQRRWNVEAAYYFSLLFFFRTLPNLFLSSCSNAL